MAGIEAETYNRIVARIWELLRLDDIHNADQTNFRYYNEATELIVEYKLNPRLFGLGNV
jgi:hypothetical protein